MKKPDVPYSLDNFIKFLKAIKSQDQKRMLFMIEAKLNLYNDSKYNTDFGIYPDYKNLLSDKMIPSPFYQIFFRAYFNLLDKKLFPRIESLNTWKTLKVKILKELSLENEIFENDYELFKFGIKLKAQRGISKVKFSEKSGLSINKITQIEESCFLCKISDINTYLSKGSGKQLILNIQ